MHVKSSPGEILKDYLIPLVFNLIVLFALITLFTLCVGKGTLIGESRMVGDEMSSPTTGRLIYGIASFVASFLFMISASGYAKKGKDTVAYWLGFTAGLLLWQSVGESFWHFSVGGTNFVPLESVMAFPLVLLFIGLIVYGKRNHSFDWGIWCTIASFACNWLGHYSTIGLYPFVKGFLAERTWNVGMSLICGGVFLIWSIFYLLFRVKTKRGRMFASMMTYIAIGEIALGIMEG